MPERLIDQLEQLIDGLADTDPHDLPDTVLLESQQRLLRIERRLHGIGARRLQVMDSRDVTTTERGFSTRAWLVEEQQLSAPDASARLRIARSSVTRPAITEALVAGQITQDQAKLITGFLPKLPDPAARDRAEKELLDAAEYADPTMMGRGLRELTDRLCLNESAEERAIRMREGRYLNFTDTIDQMVRVDGMLDRIGATILRKALHPLSLKAGEVDERTPVQRRADALVELATLAMNRGDLPESAGEPTQVTVLTDLRDLTRQLEAGDVARSWMDGAAVTPNTARMLACDAGIIPAVMNGDSEILDLGRTTRTWTRPQRKAAKIRAGGSCEAPRCQATLDRCDLHHEHHWANGGRTDLDNGIYLCAYHHWLVHHTTWEITRSDNGQVEIRRT